MASKCKFQGPAQYEFTSFEDQALSSLNNCCPRWNDGNNPKCYMIPPIFYYKHPEKPDHETINRVRNRVVVHRTSDEAEHTVFDALSMLVSEGFAAPFVALHNFNVNRVSTHLGQIFPGLPSRIAKQSFGEYDYVLIGPKIGIVVIEVKSSAFTKTGDFNLTSPQHQQWLPEKYRDGIKQLRSFDTVLDLLQLLRVTTISTNRESIRRILFNPNLTRHSYNEWYDSIYDSRRNNVNKCVKGIDRWFFEDAHPPSQLSTKLRCYLDDCHATFRLHSSVFEIYAPILVGLASVIFTKMSISIDSEALSQAEAVLRVSECVVTQDPRSLDPSYKRRMGDRSSKQTTIDLLKATILTTEQSAALKGRPRQFIIGAAGTGKTVILQAKALELLRKGESVLVLCSDFYLSHYLRFFERQNVSGFKLNIWPQIRDNLPADAVANLRAMGDSDANSDPVTRFVRQSLLNPIESTRLIDVYFKDMLDYDHILIDDAFAEEHCRVDNSIESQCIMYALLIMAYAEQTSRWKTVWVALDPFSVETYFLVPKLTEHSHAMHHLLVSSSINRPTSSNFGISSLCRVMRNPENIFQHLLPMPNIGPYQAPLIGHKIQGTRSFKTIASYDSLTSELIGLFECVKEKYPIEQIAIITSGVYVGSMVRRCLSRRNIPCGYENPNSIRNAVYIYEWNQVNSREWPVVIHIVAMRDHLYRKYSDPILLYRSYLACSRATGMLVQIALDIEDSFFGENHVEYTHFWNLGQIVEIGPDGKFLRHRNPIQ